MTGKKSIPNWQDKHLRKMDKLILDPLFQQDITNIEIGDDEDYHFAVYRLAEKWEIQPTILLRYIKDRDLFADSVSPSLSIIYDGDETSGPADSLEEAQFNYIAMRGFPRNGINLFIPPGSSQIEIGSFIKDNWSYIESKIGKPLRNKRRTTAARDVRMLVLLDEGLSYDQIARTLNDEYEKSNLVGDDVGRIIHDIQKKNK